MVSATDKAAFARDGFVVMRGLISADALRDLVTWVEALRADEDRPGYVRKYYEEALRKEGRVVLNRVEYFRRYHNGLRALMEEGAMSQIASELLGDRALLFKDKVNFKAPGGASFEPHQDAQAGWLDYCPLQLTCLVSIDAATRENGCLELASGHHKRGLIGQRWKPMTDDELHGIDFVPYETAPGDAVFFDCFAPHRSGPNGSSRERRVLYITYSRASDGDHYEQYFADKRKNFPPDVERQAGVEYRYRV